MLNRLALEYNKHGGEATSMSAGHEASTFSTQEKQWEGERERRIKDGGLGTHALGDEA